MGTTNLGSSDGIDSSVAEFTLSENEVPPQKGVILSLLRKQESIGVGCPTSGNLPAHNIRCAEFSFEAVSPSSISWQKGYRVTIS